MFGFDAHDRDKKSEAGRFCPSLGAWSLGQAELLSRQLTPELGHIIIVLRQLSEKLLLGQTLCNHISHKFAISPLRTALSKSGIMSLVCGPPQ